MFNIKTRIFRWLMLAVSGGIVLQATGCDVLQVVQTGLLGVLTGMTWYLARNV